MNKARRKMLQDIVDALDEQKSSIETVQEEEQDAYDNLPEGIQCSERGETMENNVSEMEGIASELEDLIERIREIIEN